MINKNFIVWIFVSLSISSAVYSFSIDEINQWLDSQYWVDLKWDKINYKFSKQDQIRKNENWWYINSSRDNYLDSDNNLNLDNIDKNKVDDNSKQWESKTEYDWNVIPINYYENKQLEILDNIIKKKTSFRMDFYELWAINVRKNLQIYYNPDLKSVLLGWIPSTFWFWNWTVSIDKQTNIIDWSENNDWWNTTSVNCSLSCNCWKYYSNFGRCYTVPSNWYSVGDDFECLSWYKKDSTYENCIIDSTQNRVVVPISDSPFDWIRYNWVEPIDSSDDPFWITINESSQYTPMNSSLWINDTPYSYSTADLINTYSESNYLNKISWSTWVYCNTTYGNYHNPSNCDIKNTSSIYDVPMSSVK